MIKIGITGGIGAGKTTVSNIFEVLKIPVFYADKVAKNLINTHSKTIRKIKEKFGDVYINGKLNNKKLAAIIFNNPEKLKIINNIVHPAVDKEYNKWCKKNSDKIYTLLEAAILFESGSYKKLDKIITVYAPEKIRIERVCKRDNTDEKKVKERIKNQISDEEKIKLSDFVIHNYNDNMLIPQVLEIHKKLTNTKK